MSIIVGHRNLAHELDSFFVNVNPNPDDMLSNFTEIVVPCVAGVSGIVSIFLEWSSPVMASSFSCLNVRGVPAGSTWDIRRYSSQDGAPGTLIDQVTLPFPKLYTAPGSASENIQEQAVHTFLENIPGGQVTSTEMIRRAIVRFFIPEGTQITIGMIVAFETFSLVSGVADGSTGGSSIDIGGTPTETFNGAASPADQQEIELANFSITRLSADDRSTLWNVAKACGTSSPLWFQPYPWRSTHTDPLTEGGVMRLKSKLQITPTRPQDGTTEDVFEARGVVFTPWK